MAQAAELRGTVRLLRPVVRVPVPVRVAKLEWAGQERLAVQMQEAPREWAVLAEGEVLLRAHCVDNRPMERCVVRALCVVILVEFLGVIISAKRHVHRIRLDA